MFIYKIYLITINSNLKGKTSSLIDKVKPEDNPDGLNFKKFFGWFNSEEEVKKQPESEEQYFDFTKKSETQNENDENFKDSESPEKEQDIDLEKKQPSPEKKDLFNDQPVSKDERSENLSD